MPTRPDAKYCSDKCRYAVWDATHFQLSGEMFRVIRELGALPALLDSLDNPRMAKRIRAAIKLLDGEDE